MVYIKILHQKVELLDMCFRKTIQSQFHISSGVIIGEEQRNL